MVESPKKELLFSGAMGCVMYQMGYSQALLEILGRDHLKQYSLGGVSAGAAAAGYLYCAIHSNYDLKYFYQTSARRFYEPNNKKYYGLFSNGSLIFEIGKEYWDLCQKLNIPSHNGNFHMYVTIFENFGFEKKLVDNFENAGDFAEAIHASCYLPAITGFNLYTTYKGKKAFDGGITMPIPYKYEDSEKIFINILPKTFYSWPIVKKWPSNLTMINIQEEYGLKFPMDYYPWKETWSDEMFLKGYLTGVKNKEEILRIFKRN